MPKRRKAAREGAVGIDEAMEIALRIHRSGKLDTAETLYGRIVEAAPAYADPWHFLGLLHHQTGRSDKAVELIRRSLALKATQPGAWNNLGNVLTETKRPDEAVEAYRAAIALDPDGSDARNNLAVALRTLGRLDEAEEVYRQAIALDPKHREAHDNLGRLLASRGRIQEAIACHSRALELEPRNAESRRFLAAAYAATGELEKARTVLEEWLREDPGSVTARHLLAGCSGEAVPERASDRYVEATFDGFADSFDSKLARLNYRAPDLVGQAVAAACGPPACALAVLDAGCGTGLCGPLLKPFARTLAGVDLSGRMLARARPRGCYDDLVKAELTAFLLAHAGAYDLVVSADTLCYFGALDEVAAAAAGALRPGGRLVFTVEAERSGAPFRLNPHGRYSHDRAHVEAALAGAGFTVLRLDEETLRTERGEPVRGFVATARKASA